MAAPELTTTRYVEVGVYIGQFFTPGAGSAANDRRMPCIVAKGDRLFSLANTPILRSFRYQEDLTFPSVGPFLATLDYKANGAQANPVKLYTTTGNPVPTNQWKFVQDLAGDYVQVQILDTAFDPLAQYRIDYQTVSREIADPIPLLTIGTLQGVEAEIRKITAVGPFQDQAFYEEYTHFFDPYEIDVPAADPGNAFLSSDFSAVVGAGGNTGSGVISVSGSASYNHLYNRLYTLTCTSASGVTPLRLANFTWAATPLSAGNDALLQSPSPGLPALTISIDENVPATLTNIALDDGIDDNLGVIVDFAFGLTNFTVGDTFYLQANGAGLIEIDPLVDGNTNQFTDLGAIVPNLAGPSTGTVEISSLPSEYAHTDSNVKFRLVCTSVAGGLGTRVANFSWAMYGMKFATGTFTVSELVPNSETPLLGATGITLELGFGATHFIVEDRFDWTVKAPRRFYRGKEEARNIQLSVSSVTNLANKALYTGGWLADTAEGSFGVWSADTTVSGGQFEINDGLRFYARNGYTSSLINIVPGGSRTQVGDIWLTEARSFGFLDFSLQQEQTETFTNPGQIQTDVTGAITGTVGSKYITLENLPVEILAVRKVSDSSAVGYTLIPSTQVLRLPTGFDTSYGDLEVIYRWYGSEPEPGQTYYLSGYFLRPLEMYETPFLFFTLGDAQKFLGPNSTRNDAYMGAEISFDYAIQGLYVIQVRNAADDGVYSRGDYKRAINAFLDQPLATDLTVLNSWQNIGDQLNVVDKANDPFERHECLTYFGAPIGTPIGSEREPGSLVFYSRRTFAVHGDSFSHGTRILIGSTKAKRTFTMPGGNAVQVTLDGSFLACALAAKVASFNDPKATVLLEQIIGFDEIETYRTEQNAILGGNNIIFMNDVGEGIGQLMEDVTTDDFAPDTLNLNQMTQKQYVTRDIRRTLTTAIIKQVFPSAAAGVALIEDILQTRLSTLVSRSIMGQYQDDTGNVRGITSKDIYVVRDKADPTLFRIGYNYFLATVAKRIFGLFTVSLPGGFPS